MPRLSVVGGSGRDRRGRAGRGPDRGGGGSRPLALSHLRQRGRRQEHADRPSPLRFSSGVRGSDAERRAWPAPCGRRPGGAARPCAPDRRVAGRARAEDHHRRRLPLFFDAAAEVHRRRYARPCAVHAQHGDGRVELRLRRALGRCPQRHPHPDPSSRLHPVAARHRQGRARRQQDGSRRLRPGALRCDRRGFRGLRPSTRLGAGDGHSRFGAQRRQRGHAERAYALVSRADAARTFGDGGCRPQRGGAAVPVSGAVGEPAASRFPRLCRDCGKRQGQARRGGGDSSFGQARACGAHRHRRRRPRSSASKAKR